MILDRHLLQGQLKEFESLREKMVGNIRKRFERLQGEGAAPSNHSQHVAYLEKINKDLSQVCMYKCIHFMSVYMYVCRYE